MSNEFSYAEMMPCDLCGEFWPGGDMTELEDGQIVCPDCMAEIEEEVEED